MKFNLKGLNLNMLLLVAILVGVLVVFLRQNNKCMMDEDEDVAEGFVQPRQLNTDGMYLIEHSRFKITDSLPYPNHHFRYGTEIYKRGTNKNKNIVVRNRAMTNCMKNPECIGLEIDTSGKREIREVIMNPNRWMHREEGLYDGNQLNVKETDRLIRYILDPAYENQGKPTFEKYISNDRNKNIIMKTCRADHGSRWCTVGEYPYNNYKAR